MVAARVETQPHAARRKRSGDGRVARSGDADHLVITDSKWSKSSLPDPGSSPIAWCKLPVGFVGVRAGRGDPVDQPFLSVLIPAFNEGRTLERVIDTVLKVPEDLEIVLIDDGSSDDTWRVMESRVDGDRVRSVRHDVNRGKGAAIRTGLTHARGHIVLIQDADLEYSPDDY